MVFHLLDKLFLLLLLPLSVLCPRFLLFDLALENLFNDCAAYAKGIVGLPRVYVAARVILSLVQKGRAH